MRRLFLGLVPLLMACGGTGDPTPLGPSGGDAAAENETRPISEPEGGLDEAAPPDTHVDCKLAAADGTICSCTEVGQDPPTLFLVLDRSGSMTEIVPGSGKSKWHMIRDALVGDAGVLRKLGSRVRVAVTWFPSPHLPDACNPGREVMGPAIGGKDVYDTLAAKLASVIPRGATPTAATLTVLREGIRKIKGPVHVLLATDGGPNCGVASCDTSACTYNIERAKVLASTTCDASVNCCDPAKVSSGLGWRACLDTDAAVKATAAIAATGSKVFVLGVPGTTTEYSGSLDQLAVAGGASAHYWAPTDDASLAAALSSIAAAAVDSCEVRLTNPVTEPGVTNVLLDGEVLPSDGWTWKSPSLIEIVGGGCDRVRSGSIGHVQVVVGCKTVTR